MSKRYLLPLPVALLVSFCLWELEYLLEGGLTAATRLAGSTVVFGLLSFPVGLPAAVWVPSTEVLRSGWPLVSLGGYALYIVLSVVACNRSSRRIAAVLMLLLAVNVVGCQVQGPAIQKALGVE